MTRNIRNRHARLARCVAVPCLLCLGSLLLVSCGATQGRGSLWGSASREDKAMVMAARTWDVNQDGSVTCEEWRFYAGRLFARFDGDRDGHLSAEEYTALSGTDRLFQTVPLGYFDADKDQRLSRAELVDRQNAAFTRADRNKDCRLDSAELITRPTPQTGSPVRGRGGGGRGSMPPGGSMPPR